MVTIQQVPTVPTNLAGLKVERFPSGLIKSISSQREFTLGKGQDFRDKSTFAPEVWEFDETGKLRRYKQQRPFKDTRAPGEFTQRIFATREVELEGGKAVKEIKRTTRKLDKFTTDIFDADVIDLRTGLIERQRKPKTITPSTKKVTSSRVIYEPVLNKQGAKIGEKPSARITIRDGRQITAIDLKTGQKKILTSKNKIKAQDVNIKDIGIPRIEKVFLQQLKTDAAKKISRKNTQQKERERREVLVNTFLKGGRFKTELDRIEGQYYATGKPIEITEGLIKKFQSKYGKKEGTKRAIALSSKPETIRARTLKEQKETVIISKPDKYNFPKRVNKVERKTIQFFMDNKKTQEILKNFSDDEIFKYLKNIESRTLNKLKNQSKSANTPLKRAKLYSAIGFELYRKEGKDALFNYGDNLLLKEKGLKNTQEYLTYTYDKIRNKNQKDAIEFISKEKNKKALLKAFDLIKIGTKASFEKALKSSAQLSKTPLRTTKRVVDLALISSFAPTLIKKGLESNLVVSSLTKLGTLGVSGNYGYNLVKGYKNTKDKQQYVVDKVLENLIYTSAFTKLSIKETKSLRRTIQKLSPFYRGDVKSKLTLSFPQTTPQKLAKQQAKVKNLYHVTSSKTRDLIKDNLLKIISKKSGMSKDRIRLNEDFLYLSDKGIISYGIKGTKNFQTFKIEKETSSLLKGDIRNFKSSQLLKKIKQKSNAKKTGQLNLKSFEDKFIIRFVKDNKLIIGGQRAANVQIPKKFGRKTLDWDILVKNNKETANKFIDQLNKYYGYKRFSITKTPKSYQIYDKVIKDHIVDFVKPTKQQITKIGDLKFISLKTLTNNKIKALSDARFQKRWAKDLKDLKNQLKGTGTFKEYKNLIKKYENEIFKGKYDPTKAEYTLRNLREIGLSKKAIEYLTFAEKNPLKYGAVKVLTKLNLGTKPTKYNIFEFKDIKVGQFPQSIKNRIKLASQNILTSRQQELLRIDMNNFIKKNPGKIFPGSKTLANVVKPFGLEDEFITAPGGKFIPKKNIRSKFYDLFGVKKGEGFVFDDLLDKKIEIFTVTTQKKGKKVKTTDEFKEFLKLLKLKYSDPKKLIKELLKDEKIKITVNPDGSIRRISDIQGIKKRLNLRLTPKGLETIKRRIEIKETERRRSEIKKEKRIEPSKIPRMQIPKDDRRRPEPRKIYIRQIAQRIRIRKEPRKMQESRRIINVINRIFPRRSQEAKNILREKIINRLPKFQIKKIEKKLKKDKDKITLEELLRYTTTLAGVDVTASSKDVKGLYTGLEIRGVIKKPIIFVAKGGKTKLGDVAKVSEYKRRIPVIRNGKILKQNFNILKKSNLLK